MNRASGRLPFAVTPTTDEENAAYSAPDRRIAAIVVEGVVDMRLGRSTDGAMVVQMVFPMPPVLTIPKVSMRGDPIAEVARRIRGGKVRILVDFDALDAGVREQLTAAEEAAAAAAAAAAAQRPVLDLVNPLEG